MTTHPRYVLGSDAAEVARLDGQAEAIAPATELLLGVAGIGGDMRVLDLGTGLGHVAFQVAARLGDGGSVLGIDAAAPLLEAAERRRAVSGARNVRFLEADARTFVSDQPFDALVMRLLLFHLPDALDVLRHHRDSLRPGGVILAVDFDIGAARSDPPVELLTIARDWIGAGFRAAGADPTIGARLALLLREAGFADVATIGLQSYLAADDPRGPMMVAGVVRSLAPQIVAAGIATEDELGLDTLQARLEDAVARAGAVVMLPAVVGAWGRTP